VTASSATLSWAASSGTVSNYQIERATGATSTSFSQVGTPSGTTYTDSGLAANTTYRYRVRATNSAGTSAYSGIVNVTTTGGGGGGGCTTAGAAQSQWNNGYVMQMTVTNSGSSTLNGWTSTATLPAGHTLAGSWPITATVSGQVVSQRNQAWNGALAPGQTATWGFQVSKPDGNSQLPSNFTCTSP
jgi:cellulase/cellobiase CelA1